MANPIWYAGELLGGLGGRMCSHGLMQIEKFMDRLPSSLDAHWHRHQEWDEALEEIIKKVAAMGPPEAIIVGGHSFGGKEGLKLVNGLWEHLGLTVDYLAAIDPTAWPPGGLAIPANVKYCDEFWASRGFPAAARRRDPTGGAGGMYINPHNVPHKVHPYVSSHTGLASHPEVQKIILDRVRGLVT